MALARSVMRNNLKMSNILNIRFASDLRKGLVLGVYNEGSGDSHAFKLTAAGNNFNESVRGRLEDLLNVHGGRIQKGEVQVFQNLESDFYSVAVAGLGPEDVGFNTLENLDECKENVRIAAGTGVRALSALGIPSIAVEGFGQAEAAAEGATLGAWRYQGLRAPADQLVVSTIELYFDGDEAGWKRGIIKGECQNLARTLCDTPANIMTNVNFAQTAVEHLCPCGIRVEYKDKEWLELKNFAGLLAVGKGSVEPPGFLEIAYCGGEFEAKPITLIGKGVTYDSGGLHRKKCKRMREYRGDLSGAAAIVGAFKGFAALGLPFNITACIPLCENMMSGNSMRPGDIYYAKNGKSVEIENTDHEGRIIIADALLYARTVHNPRLMIDVGTMTGGIRSALGGSSSGVYTTNHELWREISKAGAITGDRVWRFPLWEHFTKKVTHKHYVDVLNHGMGPGGFPCKGAAFLKEFVPCGDWMHIDTTGCGLLSHARDYPYLTVGRMTGRPTRTLIQFMYQVTCPPEKKAKEGKVQLKH